MRRATVSIPRDLEEALEHYRRDLEFSPSFAALMQAALKEYLEQRGYTIGQDGGPTRRAYLYEEAPRVRGQKTASEMVLEDRR